MSSSHYRSMTINIIFSFPVASVVEGIKLVSSVCVCVYVCVHLSALSWLMSLCQRSDNVRRSMENTEQDSTTWEGRQHSGVFMIQYNVLSSSSFTLRHAPQCNFQKRSDRDIFHTRLVFCLFCTSHKLYK